ncbi:DUF5316 domain-containing protein [Pseudalkalibacillus sp. R45]|uniref:DUF5316 domain-containing protein n=1 Tax=Pseudalkalibacillus sp. R45 TaxID=3457433 RepID=UPI003FCD8228
MKISLFLGTLVAFTLFLCWYFTKSELFITVSGGVGLISLIIAGLLSGVFISGDKIRANTAIEDSKERKKRNKGMFVFTLFGAPNFIVGILLTVLS